MIQIIAPRGSRSAQLLRNLCTTSPTLHASEARIAWGLQAPGACNGGPKVSNYDQLERFRAAELYTPDSTRDPNAITDPYRWIGRTNVHSEGHDIAWYGTDAWRTRDYWVRLVEPPTEEWRIHVAFGRVIARGHKVRHDGANNEVIRNRAHGWRMEHRTDPPAVCRTAAKTAVAALGYDFGGVDMLLKDGVPYVLEVNKVPGLDNYTATAYIRAFERWVAG